MSSILSLEKDLVYSTPKIQCPGVIECLIGSTNPFPIQNPKANNNWTFPGKVLGDIARL